MKDAAPLPPLPEPHPLVQWAVLGAFGIMTIAFATYHMLLRLGLIDSFLGGFLGIAGAALFVPMLLIYAGQAAVQPWRVNRGDVLFFAFMLVIGIVALLHFMRGDVVDIARGHLSGITQVTVLFVIFHLLDLRWRPFQFAMWSAFGIFAAIMLSLGLGGVTAEEYREVQLLPTEDVANYAHYAVSFLFIMIGCIALAPTLLVRLGIYAISTVTLFYNGARSELLVALALFLATESLLSRKNMVLMLGAAAALLLFGGELVSLLMESYPNNRVVQLLSDFSADQSVREREFVFEHALDVIEKNPIFGDYGYFVEGFYAHNFVSAWAELGLFGFALFIAGVLYPVVGVVDNFLRDRIDKELLAFALIAVASFILFIFAKNYAHPTFAVALALYSRQLARKRLAESTPHDHAATPASVAT